MRIRPGTTVVTDIPDALSFAREPWEKPTAPNFAVLNGKRWGTLTDTAPVLTSLGVIQWWEGHGSKAHECFQRALESDPEYSLAQLTDHLVREGILSDWSTGKQTSYQPPHTRGPEIGGLGMA